jgi:hypothetical protein
MFHGAKNQLSEQNQRKIRDKAVLYFFPDGQLKPLRAGSVLYTNRQGLVAHVSTAQCSGNDIRFWYGFRKNHLASIAQANEAYFVACCYLNDDRIMYFSFPCAVVDDSVFICEKKLLSESKEHFHVELFFKENSFFLNVFDGEPVDASNFVAPLGKIAIL